MLQAFVNVSYPRCSLELQRPRLWLSLFNAASANDDAFKCSVASSITALRCCECVMSSMINFAASSRMAWLDMTDSNSSVFTLSVQVVYKLANRFYIFLLGSECISLQFSDEQRAGRKPYQKGLALAMKQRYLLCHELPCVRCFFKGDIFIIDGLLLPY